MGCHWNKGHQHCHLRPSSGPVLHVIREARQLFIRPTPVKPYSINQSTTLRVVTSPAGPSAVDAHGRKSTRPCGNWAASCASVLAACVWRSGEVVRSFHCCSVAAGRAVLLPPSLRPESVGSYGSRLPVVRRSPCSSPVDCPPSETCAQPACAEVPSARTVHERPPNYTTPTSKSIQGAVNST